MYLRNKVDFGIFLLDTRQFSLEIVRYLDRLWSRTSTVTKVLTTIG